MLVLAAVLAFMLSLLMVVDVVGRVFFNSPSRHPEIVSGSIVVIVYLQRAYAIRSHGMLHVEVCLARLPLTHATLVLGVRTIAVGRCSFRGHRPERNRKSDALYHGRIRRIEGEGALACPCGPRV